MELSGIVEKVEDGRALVRVSEAEVQPEKGTDAVWLPAPDGIARDALIRVEMDNPFEESTKGFLYLSILGGLLLGAVAGKSIAGIDAITSVLNSLVGGFLGPLFTSGDNMALAGGMAGTVLAVGGLSLFVGKKKRDCLSRAVIIGTIKENEKN